MNPATTYMQAHEAAKVIERDASAVARLGQIITPELQANGKGYRAAYSFRNLVEMRIVEEMMKFGVPRKKIVSYLDTLRHSKMKWLDEKHTDGWIVIDGEWNWQFASDFSAIQLGWRNKQPHSFLAISIGKIRHELAERYSE